MRSIIKAVLTEKIDQDLKRAMKDREDLRVSTLRYLKAFLINLAIDKKTEQLSDADVLDVISKLVKQHHESIEGFKKGGREDLVAKETTELEILKSYCPPQASREEILEWIKTAVQESNAKGLQDLGQVMKWIMPKVKGKADGGVVHELVRQVLEGQIKI